MSRDEFNITAQGPTHAAILELVLGNRRVRLTVDADPIEAATEHDGRFIACILERTRGMQIWMHPEVGGRGWMSSIIKAIQIGDAALLELERRKTDDPAKFKATASRSFKLHALHDLGPIKAGQPVLVVHMDRGMADCIPWPDSMFRIPAGELAQEPPETASVGTAVDAEPIEETYGRDGDIVAEKVTSRLRQLERTRKQQGDRWLGDAFIPAGADPVADDIERRIREMFDPTFQRGPDETPDAYKQRITAELLARLEGAGYVFSQKRDGSWWWSDREDEGAFEGNDTPLPSKALAIAGAWAHFCERSRASGDFVGRVTAALSNWREWARDHMGDVGDDDKLRQAIDRAWGANSLKVRGALDRLFTALERAQLIDGQEHDGIADDKLIDGVIEMVPRLAALRRSTLDDVYEAHGERFTLPADVVEELKGAVPLLLERADAEVLVALRAAAGANARVRELEAGIRRALDHRDRPARVLPGAR